VNYVIFSYNYITLICLQVNNFAISNIPYIMKITNDNSNSFTSIDPENSGSELVNNQENGESENGANHFYFLMGDQNNDLKDVIKNWESIRFTE